MTNTSDSKIEINASDLLQKEVETYNELSKQLGQYRQELARLEAEIAKSVGKIELLQSLLPKNE